MNSMLTWGSILRLQQQRVPNFLCTYRISSQYLNTSSLKPTKSSKPLKLKARTKKPTSSSKSSTKPKRKILSYERCFEFTAKEKYVVDLLASFCTTKKKTFYTPQEKISLRLFGSYVKLKVLNESTIDEVIEVVVDGMNILEFSKFFTNFIKTQESRRPLFKIIEQTNQFSLSPPRIPMDQKYMIQINGIKLCFVNPILNLTENRAIQNKQNYYRFQKSPRAKPTIDIPEMKPTPSEYIKEITKQEYQVFQLFNEDSDDIDEEKFASTYYPPLLQHAMNAELTIHSLYYNPVSDVIEDHTHLGMKDIKNSILRSTTPPKDVYKGNSAARALKLFYLITSKGTFDRVLYSFLKSKQFHDELKKIRARIIIFAELYKFFSLFKAPQSFSLFYDCGVHKCTLYSPELPWLDAHSELSRSIVYSLSSSIVNEAAEFKFSVTFCGAIAPLVFTKIDQTTLDFNYSNYNKLTDFLCVPEFQKYKLLKILYGIIKLIKLLPMDQIVLDASTVTEDVLYNHWKQNLDNLANWFLDISEENLERRKLFLWREVMAITVEVINNFLLTNGHHIPADRFYNSIDRMAIPFLSSGYIPILNEKDIEFESGESGEMVKLIMNYLFRWQMFNNPRANVNQAHSFLKQLLSNMTKLGILKPKEKRD